VLRAFELHRPATVAEASALLAARPDAALYAGGTELLLLMKAGLVRPADVIDLKRIPDLGGLVDGDDALAIGATVTHRALERSALVRARWPLVAGVAAHVANVRVRNVGTVGGNLAFADPHSDLTTLFLVFDATVRLGSAAGARELPVGDFVRGPYETARRADEVLPTEAILASNTSSIPIGSLAAATSRPDRVIGMHFFNPVPVLKLVEVIRAVQTSDETAAAITKLAEDLGKVPAQANDFPGFVSNRILMPFINEAVYALMEGVAEPEAIDTVAKLGFAHPLGPLALADLIGLDTCVAIMQVLHEGLGDPKYAPCPLLRRYVAAGRLGRKSGRGFYDYP